MVEGMRSGKTGMEFMVDGAVELGWGLFELGNPVSRSLLRGLARDHYIIIATHLFLQHHYLLMISADYPPLNPASTHSTYSHFYS